MKERGCFSSLTWKLAQEHKALGCFCLLMLPCLQGREILSCVRSIHDIQFRLTIWRAITQTIISMRVCIIVLQFFYVINTLTTACEWPKYSFPWPPHLCVCRWRQELHVESIRNQQDVLGVALAAAGGAEWSGPHKRAAHLPKQCRHRSGKRRGEASGHSGQSCGHGEHPQDGQRGENLSNNGAPS